MTPKSSQSFAWVFGGLKANSAKGLKLLCQNLMKDDMCGIQSLNLMIKRVTQWLSAQDLKSLRIDLMSVLFALTPRVLIYEEPQRKILQKLRLLRSG